MIDKTIHVLMIILFILLLVSEVVGIVIGEDVKTRVMHVVWSIYYSGIIYMWCKVTWL